MSDPNAPIIQEVMTRDGLQIEPRWVPTERKIALIDATASAGVKRIEVSSFVSPKAVPSLRDAAEVFAGIRRLPGVIYTALVPNTRGAERAAAAGADEINFVMSLSETHNLANMGMSREASFRELALVVSIAKANEVALNATVATAFGCPFEGAQPQQKLVETIMRYLDFGADSITLADTTGMANPVEVRQVVSAALDLVPTRSLTLHFHNTRGLGILNVDASYSVGARRFDSSLGGIGGCPFAPGASGNVCTEDVVNYFHETGVCTGVDLRALLKLSRELPDVIGHEVPGQLVKAGLASELHPMPDVKKYG
jgi:hydroxymethylglutaryl-CoA lyase